MYVNQFNFNNRPHKCLNQQTRQKYFFKKYTVKSVKYNTKESTSHWIESYVD